MTPPNLRNKIEEELKKILYPQITVKGKHNKKMEEVLEYIFADQMGVNKDLKDCANALLSLFKQQMEEVIGSDDSPKYIPYDMYIKKGEDDPLYFGRNKLRASQRQKLQEICK